MKTYKQFNDEAESLDVATLHSVVIDRQLKSAVNKIHATNDTNVTNVTNVTNEKINLLALALRFSPGSLAFRSHKSKRK